MLESEHMMVQVPNIYNLLLGLPFKCDEISQIYFDCKIRRLFVHGVRSIESTKEDPQVSDEESNELDKLNTEVFEEKSSTKPQNPKTPA